MSPVTGLDGSWLELVIAEPDHSTALGFEVWHSTSVPEQIALTRTRAARVSIKTKLV